MAQQQISPGQLQSELESIRSLRRISLSQSSPDPDPDLPSSLQMDANSTLIISNDNIAQSTAIHPPSARPDSSTPSSINGPSDPATDEINPDLFWLPARLHPEIAPQEFKAFIEEATKPENLLRRTSSALGSRRNSSDHLNSGGLSRKKSMLSHVYDPSKDQHLLPSSPSSLPRLDNKPITRGYSMSSPHNLGRGAQGLESLTINDLQRLESLVFKKASPSSNDSSLDTHFRHLNLNDDRIRAVISRSMTIGGSSPSGPEFNPEQLDPEAIDDSPLISRAPGHIIRRTARTKVRKTSLPGDGNGHRFPATRRGQAKSPMVNSHHPRTDSTTSNDSEETVSNDLHSNRSSKEYTQKHWPDPSVHSEDDLTVTIDPQNLAPAPQSLKHGTLEHSSEDAQSIDSTSRPGSLASNSSLLDAYTHDSPSLESPLTPTVNSKSLEYSNLNAPLSDFDISITHPIKHGGQSSSFDTPQSGPVQAATSDLIARPLSEPGVVSPPGSSKPDGLKILTDLSVPVLQRHARSSEDLLSTPVSTASAVSSNTTTTFSTAKSTPSSGTLALGSPTTPVGSQSSRPPLNINKTSPNLSTASASTILSSAGPSPTKEGKEKKRAWAKLGLTSAVSTSSKSKKGKGKEKQKAGESDGSSSGQPTPVSAAGGSNNGGTTGGGSVKKESGFLSGLFGGKSRKNESEQDKQNSLAGPSGSAGNSKHHPGSGPAPSGLGPASGETQAQQQLINPTASGGFIKGRFMSFYRLPIHVERAVYRLSHIKLANPRRPLYEQVLISNLMFWYLGVINKSQVAPIKNNNNPNMHQPASPSSSSSSSSSSPAASNRAQGNGRTGKGKNHHHHNTTGHQQNQRSPGVKMWGHKGGPGGEKANGKTKASGRKKPTQPRSGWTDGDSSDSGSSDADVRPRKPDRPADDDSSESDSHSSDSQQSSSDDDEKPLGNRIRSKQQIPIPNNFPPAPAAAAAAAQPPPLLNHTPYPSLP
ncbi:hypothetical protein PCANC_04275 [Puccinia coronata f. sp. avenae]|uniref:Protein Zds1 C-terminal domain-containing protein n=1 Tax=Puccinia coronata f. sp. avenae TaxID=200324 RepID=A0A2N5S529_9BASI|nr:hypothetical protein PCASD_24026 [Puccinia coronata f. sp. avenae]PLW51286.1 hypothetical protein PCASD_01044 [Puccinia coronata f. sp. avenae]PLW53649.1 hypothetical protein PCANC_04275 [Puccinia coronata f. sp. avenae]